MTSLPSTAKPTSSANVAPTSSSALPLSPHTLGTHPGSNRLNGLRILVVGGGQRKSNSIETSYVDAAGRTVPVIGNGRAICAVAAREGASVAIADRELVNAEGTLELCLKESKTKGYAEATHIAMECDATSEESVKKMLQDTERRLGGKLDGIVCNVGGAWGSGLSGTSVELWERTMATNIRTHFLVLKHCKPHLSPTSSIVLISSTAAVYPGSGYPAYHASKSGLHGLMLHSAYELAPFGVRVNTVLPGLIDTPLGRVGSASRPDRAKTSVPLGRQGTGWDVAWAVCWLLSGESSYVTAIDLVVDGGISSISARGAPAKI